MLKELAFVVLIMAVIFGAYALGVPPIWSALLGFPAAALFYFIGSRLGPLIEFFWEQLEGQLPRF